MTYQLHHLSHLLASIRAMNDSMASEMKIRDAFIHTILSDLTVAVDELQQKQEDSGTDRII